MNQNRYKKELAAYLLVSRDLLYHAHISLFQIDWQANRVQQIASLATIKQAEQWKTTIDLLCLNREEGHTEVGKDNQIHTCMVN